MIVTCERCETQFQLDEARVPEDGVRVRCSRCKHAFVVYRPTADAAEEIHRAAGEAARVGETPDATRDLPDSNELSGADWEFNVDEPGPARPRAPAPEPEPEQTFEPESDFGVVGPDDSLSLSGDDDAAAADAAGPEAEPLSLVDEPAPRSPAESLFGASLDLRPGERDEAAGAASAGNSLGGSDAWDIFDELTGKTSKGPAPTPAAPATREFAEVAVSETSPAAPAKVRAPRARLRLRAGLLSGVGNGAGWLATAALVAIGLVRGLAPPAEAAAPAVAGVSVEALGARWVENARLGRLYVVSGELRAADGGSAAMQPLVLVLRDATGQALDPALPLGEPRPDRILREGGADALRARPIELRRPLGPGEARRFEVVAWPLPAEAERFEVVASSERAGR